MKTVLVKKYKVKFDLGNKKGIALLSLRYKEGFFWVHNDRTVFKKRFLQYGKRATVYSGMGVITLLGETYEKARKRLDEYVLFNYGSNTSLTKI